ncbi:unnamed protein product [Brassicogethes aeneus]|uniref:Beta-glucosidase n=1 Tax=Brassicogethes aeneus TaxID=1431903 RepID=A0A9P0AW70_BRAAE|nr:unnamed protein product [Brassicogethes aeneus]
MIIRNIIIFCVFVVNSNSCNLKFPEGFQFGVASSAYQVEGAYKEDGKGLSIWDEITHQNPLLFGFANGDVTSDSYHHLKDDVALLKNLGVDYYRFSLSWSRILPQGTTNVINQKGIDYYNDLINELLANNIQPLVTLFHWDTPLSFKEGGGFYSESIINYFYDYANLAFSIFGDRVKTWTTFNEPKSFCQEDPDGFLGSDPSLGWLDYTCAHNLLRAHSQVYHLYNNTYKPKHNGIIGPVYNLEWDEPASNKTADLEAAERRRQFDFGWYFNPLVFGDYPEIMKTQIANYSKAQNLSRSRLPEFTDEEKNQIKGTFDYIGLNHYSAWLIKDGDGVINVANPSFTNDYNAEMFKDPSWPGSSASWLKVAPLMFRKELKWIKDTYNNPLIFVTENGYADDGELIDTKRINYIKLYLTELLKAIHFDKVNVQRYTHWSLMDSFEWNNGFRTRFGLHHINFLDPKRTRTPKFSSKYYKSIIWTRKVPFSDKCVN